MPYLDFFHGRAHMKRNNRGEAQKRRCLYEIKTSLKRCLENTDSSIKKARKADYHDGYNDGFLDAKTQITKNFDIEIDQAVNKIMIFYEEEITRYNLVHSMPTWVM